MALRFGFPKVWFSANLMEIVPVTYVERMVIISYGAFSASNKETRRWYVLFISSITSKIYHRCKTHYISIYGYTKKNVFSQILKSKTL